ncbi:hypothetical protein IGB42_01941 [Andreprevotia sp. IGB-42]|uniref:antibiotic biosynthesis monooxygenase n=1 Tax=Andreprevotia sp. IGB-42 TaxID=2497473 RepID=UPI0013589CBD|nr:antibiotic biosynthesis monooxygenase [Andreprevotia sp. IGB-42]KAF0813590.1 hypothetical protein IGB42_01941 [Andreprevotia sp. IGB-42]
MPESLSINAATPLFRVDKFAVPAGAMPAFMAQVNRINELVSTLPGCMQNLVLTDAGQGSDFNVVTLAEWASDDAFTTARAFVQQRHAAEGFDPAAYMQQLGIRADMGLFRPA